MRPTLTFLGLNATSPFVVVVRMYDKSGKRVRLYRYTRLIEKGIHTNIQNRRPSLPWDTGCRRNW